MNAMIRTLLGLGLVALIAGPAAGPGPGGFGRGGSLACSWATPASRKS